MKRKHIVHKHIAKFKQVKKSNKKTLILSIVVILLILAVSYCLIFKDKVVATVNGEKISEKRVDAIYNSLPSNSKIPKAQILQQIIDMKLLAHYAEKQGYGLSNATFESELKKLLSKENKPMDEFEKELDLWGIDNDDFKESMEISIFVQGVLENNQEAAANIIENERKTADIAVHSKYE